ncbi:metal-sensitive transcriptional regulator [Leucobacter sp. wl10]|nr:metal-sensitive transcriptional regulator [Leucobacter sp. wl10]
MLVSLLYRSRPGRAYRARPARAPSRRRRRTSVSPAPSLLAPGGHDPPERPRYSRDFHGASGGSWLLGTTLERQARGIAKMIDEEQYRIDILTRISALTRAIQSVTTGLLDDHRRHCALEAVRLGDDAAREKLREATGAINRLVRS